MAVLLAQSLSTNRSRVVQAVVKALEVILLSTGLISTLLVFKGAVFVPNPCGLVLSSLVGFWNSVNCFLSSPFYICLIINFVVLLIKISSTFRRHESTSHQSDDHGFTAAIVSILPPPSRVVAKPLRKGYTDTTSRSHVDYPNVSHANREQDCAEKSNLSCGELMPQAPEIKKTRSSLNPKSNLEGKMNVNMETKSFPYQGGKGISMEKEERTNDDPPREETEEDDSMEATWKAIMGGGKQRPKKKALKKSETWDVPATKPNATPMKRLDSEEVVPSSPKWREMRNAESFNDSISITRRGGLIRKDPSMSLEEFNKKVDDFIKKFKWRGSKGSGGKHSQ